MQGSFLLFLTRHLKRPLFIETPFTGLLFGEYLRKVARVLKVDFPWNTILQKGSTWPSSLGKI